MSQQDIQWLGSIRPEIGCYIAGFVDGEGSFNISLRKRDDHTLRWQVVPSFNVSQRDRVILAWMKTIFGCGTLRARQDGVVYYEVTNLLMLSNRVIPFFRRFGFRSAGKKRNLSIFAKSIEILIAHPLNMESLEEVVRLRETLNIGRGRKRKYSQNDVLKK